VKAFPIKENRFVRRSDPLIATDKHLCDGQAAGNFARFSSVAFAVHLVFSPFRRNPADFYRKAD
jgi:hypothetical protein